MANQMMNQITEIPSHRGFHFPLNVYAELVHREEGHVRCLHYGLFETPDESAGKAQARSTQKVLAQLPAVPSQILEIGTGLGDTLSRLLSDGYLVTSLTPDAAQIAYARHTLSENASHALRRTTLEAFSESEGEWDTLLFQESAQYIHPLALFEKAQALLRNEGEILILDEFAIKKDSTVHEPLHVLSYFLRLAERFGFALVHQDDFTQKAAPTLDWLLKAQDKHAKALEAELGIPPDTLAQLRESNLRYQARYREGHIGYFLLRFQKKSAPSWPLGLVDPSRKGAMQALFEQCFSKVMNDAIWEWKYAEGRGFAVAAFNPENPQEMIVHYGGLRRGGLLFGHPIVLSQACDVMVAPAFRRMPTQKGPLFVAVSTFFEQEAGYGAPSLLCFGFPNKAAYRVPVHLGLYSQEGVACIKEINAQTTLERPLWAFSETPFDPERPAHITALNQAWAEMAETFRDGILGIRDADYLLHRYSRHPERRYRIFIIRHQLKRTVLGVLVLGEHEDGRCTLMELIGRKETLWMLLCKARYLAGKNGYSRLFGWIADHHKPLFERCPPGFDFPLTDVIVPGNAWTAGPSLEETKGKWWFSMGDTDFL
jgi:cyclopropane fatty-acyl-phospholipid synthase-like methyltransferase